VSIHPSLQDSSVYLVCYEFVEKKFNLLLKKALNIRLSKKIHLLFAYKIYFFVFFSFSFFLFVHNFTIHFVVCMISLFWIIIFLFISIVTKMQLQTPLDLSLMIFMWLICEIPQYVVPFFWLVVFISRFYCWCCCWLLSSQKLFVFVKCTLLKSTRKNTLQKHTFQFFSHTMAQV
jgi:hypothetical protein